jgi:hypothetical protein
MLANGPVCCFKNPPKSEGKIFRVSNYQVKP